MSDFKATVERLIIEEHPNADSLELAVIGGYRSIVRKGEFTTGELAVYIPEQAIVPDWLIEKLGLVGKLAGRDSNRVKAIKLRGIVSQGLIVSLVDDMNPDGVRMWTLEYMKKDTLVYEFNLTEGDDLTELLGIIKYNPPIPTSMGGQVWPAGDKCVKYDIENWKNFPEVLKDGEEVVFTEKIHGTFSAFGYVNGEYIVASKGLGGKGLAFKLDDSNMRNLYVRQFFHYGVKEFLDELHKVVQNDVHILAEIFGPGVQDLGYGQASPSMRIFDIYNAGAREYLGYDVRNRAIRMANDAAWNKGSEHIIFPVPELYRGPFSLDAMADVTSGKETVSGDKANLREGIVMTPVEERRDIELGRVILKSVSDAYLLRKGDTTEYQ